LSNPHKLHDKVVAAFTTRHDALVQIEQTGAGLTTDPATWPAYEQAGAALNTAQVDLDTARADVAALYAADEASGTGW
jgi:hypothetical protein